MTKPGFKINPRLEAIWNRTRNSDESAHRSCDGLCFDLDAPRPDPVRTTHRQANQIQSGSNMVPPYTGEYYDSKLQHAFEESNSKILWHRIPKTGTHSLAKFLNLSTGTWDHYSAKYMIEILGRQAYDDAFKFTFVRHPLDWLTSFYEHHRGPGWRLGSICIESFDEWIERGCPHNAYKRHPRLGTMFPIGDNALLQSNWLVDADEAINIDFVGKIENFDNDVVTLDQRLWDADISTGTPVFDDVTGGLSVAVESRTVQRLNRGCDGTKKHWHTYYTSPITRRLAEFFQKTDLDRFNY